MHFVSAFDNVIIVGDFNLPDVNWATLTGTSSFSKAFCDFTFDFNLTQFVSGPTHTKGNIVLTNTHFIQDVNVKPSSPLLTSDHFIVSFKIVFYSQLKAKTQSQFIYVYKNADMNSFREYLLDCDFTACFQSKYVEQVWAITKSALYKAMDLYVPKVKLKRYKHPR